MGEFFSIIRSKQEKDDHRYMTGTFAASDFHPFRKCFCTMVGWGGVGRQTKEEGRRERGKGRSSHTGTGGADAKVLRTVLPTWTEVAWWELNLHRADCAGHKESPVDCKAEHGRFPEKMAVFRSLGSSG